MGLAGIAERLTAKKWTPEIAEAYVGHIERTCIAHASDEMVREIAASGGAVTAVLLALLESGEIDGALVCRSAIDGGRVRARYTIATSREELLEARGSTYVLGEFVRDAVPLVADFDGKLAVVGLPCEITALTRRDALAAKVAVRVSLFCGHATTHELVDSVVIGLAKEAGGGELTSFRFRVGHWRGMMRAGFDTGVVVEKPFSRYGLHQNLYYFAAKKCMFCGDHFGYDADLSAGDIWSQRYKSHPIKYTALIAKTPAGLHAIELAEESGDCGTIDIPIDHILDGQRRAAPFHYNVSARSQAGAKLGMKIPDRLGAPVRWHERMAASIALRDYLATQTPQGAGAILHANRRMLKLKLLLFKGLESLS